MMICTRRRILLYIYWSIDSIVYSVFIQIDSHNRNMKYICIRMSTDARGFQPTQITYKTKYFIRQNCFETFSCPSHKRSFYRQHLFARGKQLETEIKYGNGMQTRQTSLLANKWNTTCGTYPPTICLIILMNLATIIAQISNNRYSAAEIPKMCFDTCVSTPFELMLMPVHASSIFYGNNCFDFINSANYFNRRNFSEPKSSLS